MGTCRMGPRNDPIAVVSDELNVYGVDGLCIADSSTMPEMVSANLYATTLMIEEKASDMILERPPLPPVELKN